MPTVNKNETNYDLDENEIELIKSLEITEFEKFTNNYLYFCH